MNCWWSPSHTGTQQVCYGYGDISMQRFNQDFVTVDDWNRKSKFLEGNSSSLEMNQQETIFILHLLLDLFHGKTEDLADCRQSVKHDSFWSLYPQALLWKRTCCLKKNEQVCLWGESSQMFMQMLSLLGLIFTAWISSRLWRRRRAGGQIVEVFASHDSHFPICPKLHRLDHAGPEEWTHITNKWTNTTTGANPASRLQWPGSLWSPPPGIWASHLNVCGGLFLTASTVKHCWNHVCVLPVATGYWLCGVVLCGHICGGQFASPVGVWWVSPHIDFPWLPLIGLVCGDTTGQLMAFTSYQRHKIPQTSRSP